MPRGQWPHKAVNIGASRRSEWSLPIVTCRLNGQGEGSPQDYLAFMRLGDLVDLLLRAGYGDFSNDLAKLEPMRCKQCGAWAFTETCRMCEPDANL